MNAVAETQLLLSISKDTSWLQKNYGELVETHNNKFVAIRDQEIVASAKTMSELVSSLKAKKMSPNTTLIKYLTTAATIL